MQIDRHFLETAYVLNKEFTLYGTPFRVTNVDEWGAVGRLKSHSFHLYSDEERMELVITLYPQTVNSTETLSIAGLVAG